MTETAGLEPFAPPERRGDSPLSRFARFTLPPLAVAAGVIGLWLLVTYGLLREDQRTFLPPPQEVLSNGFFDWNRLQPILEGLARTTVVTLAGLTIAFVIGTLYAILMSQTYWLERTLYPYAVIVQTLPLVALAPLIGLKMGFSTNARITICAIISVFPIVANTLFGLKSPTAAQNDLFTLQGASRWTRLRKLQIPAALPAIFAGLRIAAGLSVIGAIVGEFFFRAGDPTAAGLGRQLSVYQSRQQTDLVISALFFSCLLGVVLFATFTMIGNRLTRSWSESAERPTRPSRPRRGVLAGESA